MAENCDIDADQLHKKLDQVCSRLQSVSKSQTQMQKTQDEMQTDIKQLHKQMPGEAQLQTQEGCKRIKGDIDDKVKGNERRARWRDAGIGVVALSALGWHIRRLVASGAHRAADTLKNIVQAWI